MTQKHRETARRVVERWIAVSRPNLIELNQLNTPDLVESFTTALATTDADAYARAKAEDAEIARQRAKENAASPDPLNNNIREDEASTIALLLLASSPGPSLGSRIRAEIAEQVRTKRHAWQKNREHHFRNRNFDVADKWEAKTQAADEIVAIIERGGK